MKWTMKTRWGGIETNTYGKLLQPVGHHVEAEVLDLPVSPQSSTLDIVVLTEAGMYFQEFFLALPKSVVDLSFLQQTGVFFFYKRPPPS